MAASDKICGYQCEFAHSISEDYVCKVCKYVARDPNITSCCGEHFCHDCISPILQDKKLCPSCKEPEFTIFLNRNYKTRILALQVHCTMKGRGCNWTGQLKHLDAHLDVNTGDCQQVDIQCPTNCDQKIQKCNVDNHVANECPKREYVCVYCNYKATYEMVTNDHWPVCSYYPLKCRHRCGVTCERSIMVDHLNICRLEEVECVFSYAGCKEKFLREDEERHMEQNTQKHLALMATETLRISREIEQKETQYEQKLQEQREEFEQTVEEKDRQIRAVEEKWQNELQQQIQAMAAKVTNLEGATLQNTLAIQNDLELGFDICPSFITMRNFNQHRTKNIKWQSSLKYTHRGGYRFNFSIHANSPSRAKAGCEVQGTHVAVWLWAKKGDFDSRLKWPADVTISVQLLNQHRDQDHVTVTKRYQWGREKIDSWLLHIDVVGYRFISHADLEWNEDRQTQYLKNDCLRFRIERVEVHSQ